MKDFIGIYTNGVDPGLCDWIIEFMDQSSFVDAGEMRSPWRQDKQVLLESFSPGEAKHLQTFVGKCLKNYIDECAPFISTHRCVSSLSLIQKTEPMQGYHGFHSESTTWQHCGRTFAWMVYLNDVEEGGETEFLYQKTKVKPEKGKVVIWPGGFTHPHRGNPPMSDKYIATGWFQPDSGSFGQHIFNIADMGETDH
tara:strand:- start:44 stop:631 length:588 start_codon:yes stop_codon:yes gene_type:complete